MENAKTSRLHDVYKYLFFENPYCIHRLIVEIKKKIKYHPRLNPYALDRRERIVAPPQLP